MNQLGLTSIRAVTATVAALAVSLVTGCAVEDEKPTRRAMPAVAAAHFNQLSSGVGARIYHFNRPDGETFAAVLITGSDIEETAVVEPNQEYWRMNPAWTPGETFTIEVAWSGTRVRNKVVKTVFEGPTKGWSGWTVNRGFTLDDFTTTVYDAPDDGRYLYSVYGPAPAGLWKDPDVDTFLEYNVMFEMDPDGGHPEVHWSLAAESFATYDAAQSYVSDPQTTIISTSYLLREDSREVLFFGASKAVRVDENAVYCYSAM